MSLKSFIQLIILFLIVSIIGVVYFKYFETKSSTVEEVSLSENRNELLEELERKIDDLEKKNVELNNKIENTKNNISKKNISKLEEKVEIVKDEKSLVKVDKDVEKKLEISRDNEQIDKKKKEIKNVVKDIEYTSIDQRGNQFILLANSGKSNINNNDLLDLDNVRGEIKSDRRDTIFIVSDFAQYNTLSLNSKFYQNVKINYQDKEITCENFDINMETNKAIAYNNVIIEDPKSVMKAGIIEFDLKTKNININPETTTSDIEIISN